MHRRELGKQGLKYVCPECGAAFNFRTEIEKHQDSGFKRCPGRRPGGVYTAFQEPGK